MKHPDDELSAYLDGECRRPDVVEAHLRACPECAARLEALRTVSAAVKTLQAPDVRPEFLTRVMAHAADTPRERPARLALHPWRYLTVGLAACAALMIGVALFLSESPTPPAGLPVAAQGDAAAPFADDDALAEHLASRPDWAERLASDLEFLPSPEIDSADVPDEAVAALDDSGLLAELAEELDTPDDLDTMVSAMNDDERAAFIALLQEYQEEG